MRSRGQGSIAVVAIVLVVALSILLTLYTVMMNRMMATFTVIESASLKTQLSARERLNVSVVEYYYIVHDRLTYIDTYIQVVNIGTVSTSVYKAIAVCMNAWGRVRTAVIAQTVEPLSLQPGASGYVEVYGYIPARCFSVTIVLVTIYGNSYEVTIS